MLAAASAVPAARKLHGPAPLDVLGIGNAIVDVTLHRRGLSSERL
jgi:hypothetical protein